jgi:hypothetical protein
MGIPHRKANEDLVRTDRAHAALVIDADDLAQGWCQYGSPEELRASNTGPSMRRTPRRIQTGGSPASRSIKSAVMPGLPCRDSHRVSPYLPATRKQNVRNLT